MSEGIVPLGIDNVLFAVGDLGAAVSFYERCGLALKFRVDRAGMALFAIGDEAPGLLLRRQDGAGGGRVWVEVADADAAAGRLDALGIATAHLETATGITTETTDPWGNVIGFADYSRRPEMARR